MLQEASQSNLDIRMREIYAGAHSPSNPKRSELKIESLVVETMATFEPFRPKHVRFLPVFWVPRDCPNICDGDGVPLARVWVWDKKKDNCRVCRVAYIDAYPPYRRFLGRDCWTAHAGCVDLSRYIWRDVEEVRAELHGLGFGVVEAEEIKNPNIFVNLGEAPEGVDLLCATPKDTVRIHSYMDHCNRQRVVLFDRMPQ